MRPGPGVSPTVTPRPSTLPLPDSVRLVEVGLRDGLQILPEPIPTHAKVHLIEQLLDAGVRHIEAVSFAHPKVLPQLADAEQVMAAAPRGRGAVYRGLVPNRRGAERASACGLHEIVALTCADEGVARLNQGREVAEILAELPAIGALARAADAALVVGVAMAFFAPGRGPIPAAERMRCVDAAVDAGAEGVYLACSTGMEDPRQVADGVAAVRARHPHLEVGVHLHARNGMGLANAVAAMGAGATWLEGAFGGLGGDLWAPGPPEVLGNVAFEDLVNLTEALGVATGVNLNRYLSVVGEVARLTGWRPQSAVVAGGTRAELAAHRWPADPQPGPAAPAAASDPAWSDPAALARQWFRAHDANDVDALATVLADEVTVHSLFRPEPARGRPAALRHFQTTMGAFPDLQLRVDTSSLSKDGITFFAAVHFVGHFTGSWTRAGVTERGAGQPFDVPGVVVLTLGPTGVRNVRTLFDRDDWLTQIQATTGRTDRA